MNLLFDHSPWMQSISYALRYEVFVLEQQIDKADEFDSFDTKETDCFLLLDEQTPVATMRYQRNKTVFHPDRVCVAKHARNKGYGTYLLKAAEKHAQADGCVCSILSAELSAITFYEKSGYERFGAPFIEDGILCVKMRKELSVKTHLETD
ncbi:MAG: GNAT family N-acetyltransferase [Enterococcus sp.]